MTVPLDAMPSYLGIDPSLEGTGLCLISPKGEVIRSLTVDPRGSLGMARLVIIKRAALEFLRQPVARAAVEGYAYGAVNQAFALGEVGGTLRLMLHEHGVAYDDVPPVNLKKFATGLDEADKEDMLAAAQAEGTAIDDHNQADAFFLALVARAMDGHRPLPRRQLEVVTRLTNPKPKKARRRPRRLVKNPI